MIQKGFNLNFLTWNLYLGANIVPLFFPPPTKEELPKITEEVYRQFSATNFPVRARAIAKQIKEINPDIIGLQEVAIWTLSPPQGTKASKVVTDFLNILLCTLKKR
ncbi:hypothetical protein LC087_07205 [Bacillus carboniphilus]|uniref:Endonuclease/exonuclease/phosphatase domain-containing protein n=1 Tax=Bacillus carboniphilus TaxID=86663 RepID=A0ABY9JWW2_9BACI|nr:endonuclease/exonuclease/phosphatase family protein [Bacillus carboniphilus]WLR43897.1 hypothetical protein LC087_07205 [Bacillus carboniphilus]